MNHYHQSSKRTWLYIYHRNPSHMQNTRCTPTRLSLHCVCFGIKTTLIALRRYNKTHTTVTMKITDPNYPIDILFEIPEEACLKGITRYLIHCIPAVTDRLSPPEEYALVNLFEHLVVLLPFVHKQGTHLAAEVVAFQKKSNSYPWQCNIGTDIGKVWMVLLCRVALLSPSRLDEKDEDDPFDEDVKCMEECAEPHLGLQAYLERQVFYEWHPS